MKVLHLVYSGMGGATNLVFSIVEGDRSKKLNHGILFSGPIFFKSNKFRSIKLNIKFYWTRTFKFFQYCSYLSILKNIFLFKPEVIILHNYMIIPCLIYKLMFKNTKIIYVNHKYVKGTDWRDLFVSKFISFFDKFIVLNKESLNFFKKKFNLSSNKIKLIHNGVNTHFFKEFKKTKKNYFKIGMACRVNKLKKYDLVMASLLSKELKDLNICFSVAGTGEDLKNFRNRIEKNKVGHKIKLEGSMNEIKLKKWYNSLDLYVQASVGEGMSMSILEAMSMKIPVIGSNVTGINSVIGKKIYLGKLFNNNVKDLSKKIKYFYYLKKKRRLKYINTQYKYINNNCNTEHLFEKYFATITK